MALTAETWIHVNGSGMGTGTVIYAVDSNVSNCAPRTGLIDINGTPFTINQAAGQGVYHLLTAERQHASGPSTGSVTVVASSSNCAWNAIGVADWITLTSTNAGTGNGAVDYAVAANTNAIDRVATIVIAGEAFTILQLATRSLDVDHLRARLNFKKPNADQYTIKAFLQAGHCTNRAGVVVNLDVGGAQVAFTLDAKGQGFSSDGHCRLSHTTGGCKFEATLRHGSWQTSWAGHGLLNTNIANPGVAVTLPVTLMIGGEIFIADQPLRYTAKSGRSGIAKPPPTSP
jgi:hypothetical protein